MEFYLLQSLQNYLNGKFSIPKDSKRHLGQFFAKKDNKFLEQWNYDIAYEKRQMVVKQNNIDMFCNKVLDESEKLCLLFLLQKQRKFLANTMCKLTTYHTKKW